VKCLDTNAIIAAINRRPETARTWLIGELAAGTTIGVPIIAFAEMVYGYEKSDRRTRSEASLRAFLSLGVEVWDFEMADAEHAGEIRAVLERNGTPIGLYDCLIAAQARRRGAVLVTLNKREFSRVPGLVITDWTQ
jgi:tRNA(fMet)-specific endonuclease VapC